MQNGDGTAAFLLDEARTTEVAITVAEECENLHDLWELKKRKMQKGLVKKASVAFWSEVDKTVMRCINTCYCRCTALHC